MLQTSVEILGRGRVYAESTRLYVQRKINQPESQCHMVLVIVSMALLLDNMLYMVIVPIVPHYLAWLELAGSPNHTSTMLRRQELAQRHKLELYQRHHKTNVTAIPPMASVSPLSAGGEPAWLIMDHNSREVGVLFACKAIVQLLVNPLSGTVIDRIGYDIPMMIGLIIIFISTTAFAFGQNVQVMFLARGLQGVGSAFADTAGLAMIADRFTEEESRTRALGIALAFISFGSLVAPPFGGILYQYCGKEAPFFCLAFVALIDGFLLMFIMKPVRLERRELQAEGGAGLPRGTPIHKLLMDPYIAICAGCLSVANVSLAFLEPTITNWMLQWNPRPTKSEIGLIWLPSFFPHVAGVYTTVKLASKYPSYQWLMAAVGLAMEGISCIFIPICSNFLTLMLPLCFLCYGIALVDTAILPTLGYLVDTRHVSVYGSIYAIADISYSLAYAIGPIAAGYVVTSLNFVGLNILVFLVTIAYVPVLYFLRNIYQAGLSKLLDNAEGAEADLIKPGRKKSYLMNGTSLEARNLQNIHSADFRPNEKDTAVLSQPPLAAPTTAYSSGGVDEVDSLLVGGSGGSPTPQNYSSTSSAPSMPNTQIRSTGPNTAAAGDNKYTDNIRRNQYGY